MLRAPPAGGSSPVCGRAVPGPQRWLSWPPWPKALPCVRFSSLSSLKVAPETGVDPCVFLEVETVFRSLFFNLR